MKERHGTAIAAGIVFSVPAFSAQPVAVAPYDSCLLHVAQSGAYYSSLDGGKSALQLMYACDAYRHAWLNQCASDGTTYGDCQMLGAMRALLTIVALEDIRAFSHPANGERP